MSDNSIIDINADPYVLSGPATAALNDSLLSSSMENFSISECCSAGTEFDIPALMPSRYPSSFLDNEEKHNDGQRRVTMGGWGNEMSRKSYNSSLSSLGERESSLDSLSSSSKGEDHSSQMYKKQQHYQSTTSYPFPSSDSWGFFVNNS